MSKKDHIGRRAALHIHNSRGLDFKRSKIAVDWLMWNLNDTTEPVGRIDHSIPHIRYIHMVREGCLGFCGEKLPHFGPPELNDGKRLSLGGTVRGGFGGSAPDYAVFGVMYWGERRRGLNHIVLANRYNVPAIYLYQKSPYRNQPRPSEWGYYEPSSS